MTHGQYTTKGTGKGRSGEENGSAKAKLLTTIPTAGQDTSEASSPRSWSCINIPREVVGDPREEARLKHSEHPTHD